MKQPYRWLLGTTILITVPLLVTYLVVTVHEAFAIGYVIWAIVFGLLLNDFHMFD